MCWKKCPIFRKPARSSSILYVQEGPKEVYEDGRRILRRNVSMGSLSNYNFTVASDANASARISKVVYHRMSTLQCD
jgi:hypothetical protein